MWEKLSKYIFYFLNFNTHVTIKIMSDSKQCIEKHTEILVKLV